MLSLNMFVEKACLQSNYLERVLNFFYHIFGIFSSCSNPCTSETIYCRMHFYSYEIYWCSLLPMQLLSLAPPLLTQENLPPTLWLTGKISVCFPGILRSFWNWRDWRDWEKYKLIIAYPNGSSAFWTQLGFIGSWVQQRIFKWYKITYI